MTGITANDLGQGATPGRGRKNFRKIFKVGLALVPIVGIVKGSGRGNETLTNGEWNDESKKQKDGSKD